MFHAMPETVLEQTPPVEASDLLRVEEPEGGAEVPDTARVLHRRRLDLEDLADTVAEGVLVVVEEEVVAVVL